MRDPAFRMYGNVLARAVAPPAPPPRGGADRRPPRGEGGLLPRRRHGGSAALSQDDRAGAGNRVSGLKESDSVILQDLPEFPPPCRRRERPASCPSARRPCRRTPRRGLWSSGAHPPFRRTARSSSPPRGG